MQKLALVLLGTCVVGEGVALVSLQRQVGRLTARLGEPAEAAPGATPAVGSVPARRLEAPSPVRPAGSVPLFASTAPAAVSAPVLDTLGSPQGRQKLQEILASFKEERRREKMLSSLDKRVQSAQRLRAALGELALDPEETRKTEEILDRLTGLRRQLLDELQAGAKSRADVKKELDAASRGADASLQEVLGEKRMSAFRELRKRTDRAPEAPVAAAARP